MEENPFTITEKVIPKYFCDRVKESDQMVRLITNRNNVVLISPRRIGKTALIQFCFQKEEIKKNYNTFYIDILSTNNLQEFVFLFGKQVYNRVAPLGERMIKKLISSLKTLSTKIGYDPLNGIPTLNFQLGDITRPEITLDEIFKYLSSAEKPSIVAIDEFQQIAKYPEKGVEALIRSHILQINNCRFIFSGSERHLLGEMFLNSKRPFYHSSSMMELSPIPREIYADFIVKMFHLKNRNIDKEIALEIYDSYDGITFCIQKICNIIFSLTPEGGKAQRSMISLAEEEILYSYDTLYRERLLMLTSRQKEILFAIAQEGKVESPTSIDFIKSHSLSSASSVQSAMKALINQEIIGKENLSYLIPDRFFSIWIKKNYGNG